MTGWHCTRSLLESLFAAVSAHIATFASQCQEIIRSDAARKTGADQPASVRPRSGVTNDGRQEIGNRPDCAGKLNLETEPHA